MTFPTGQLTLTQGSEGCLGQGQNTERKKRKTKKQNTERKNVGDAIARILSLLDNLYAHDMVKDSLPFSLLRAVSLYANENTGNGFLSLC